METATVGKVLVAATIENHFDLEASEEGRCRRTRSGASRCRTRASIRGRPTFALPKRLIDSSA